MRNFLLKTRESSPHKSRVHELRVMIAWCVVLLVVIFVMPGLLRTSFHFVVAPISTIRHYILTSTASVPTFIRDRAQLLERIQELEELESRQADIRTTLLYVENENRELRELLHDTKEEGILAGVIARPPDLPYDTMLIDRGDTDGIKKGAPVFYGDQHVLGFIETTFAHHALVRLISSAGLESSVYVFGPQIFARAYGEGGGVIRLSVPQGVSITEGDVVVLPSLSVGILGAVESVQSLPSEPEQHAYLTFSTPIQSVRLVRVGEQSIQSLPAEEMQAHIESNHASVFSFPIPESFTLGTTSEASATNTKGYTTP
jgi:cell shape-determining protein MreC